MKIAVCPGEDLQTKLLKQTDRICCKIQTLSDELNWARRRTFHELNSLSLVRLIKSSMFGSGLTFLGTIEPIDGNQPVYTVYIRSYKRSSLLPWLWFLYTLSSMLGIALVTIIWIVSHQSSPYDRLDRVNTLWSNSRNRDEPNDKCNDQALILLLKDNTYGTLGNSLL